MCGFEPRGEPSTALIDGVLGAGYRKPRRIQIVLGGQANDVVAWPVCRQTASSGEQFIDNCSMHNIQAKPKHTILFYFMLNTYEV